jgi:hypothetical protein
MSRVCAPPTFVSSRGPTTIAVLVSVCLGGAAPATSENPRPATKGDAGAAPEDIYDGWEQVCAADVARLCRDAAPMPPRACLWQRENEMSDDCWRKLIKPGRFGRACLPDLNRFCRAGVKAQPACLTDNREDLTAPCRAYLDDKRVAKDGTVRPWLSGKAPPSGTDGAPRTSGRKKGDEKP